MSILNVSLGEDATQTAVQVVNKGVGGNNTLAALKRFDKDVIALKPNYLIIYLGINDSVNSKALVPLETYKANLQKMLDTAKKNKISPILATLHPVIEDYVKKRHPQHPAENINAFLENYDGAVRKLAAENNVPLVDLRKLVESYAPLDAKNSLIRNKLNSNTMDGVHFTAEGYRKFAELLEPVFKNKIKRGDIVVCFGDSITYGAGMKGAGTACGDSYPAQLSLILNKLATE